MRQRDSGDFTSKRRKIMADDPGSEGKPYLARPKPEHFVEILSVIVYPCDHDKICVVPQTANQLQLPFLLSRNAARKLCEKLAPYLSEPQE
jgi:hypothetical protein